MISVEEAKKIISNTFPSYNIYRGYDIGNQYAFGLSDKKSGERIPGVPVVCVDKKKGKISYLSVPPISNLELLKKGTLLD